VPERPRRIALITPEVCALFEISRSRLMYYQQTGLVEPLKKGVRGRGKHGKPEPSVWGWRQLYRLATVRRLQRMKMSTQALRKVLRFVEKHNYTLERVLLRVWKEGGGVIRDVEIIDEDATVSSLAKPGQLVFRFALEAVPVREIREDVEKKVIKARAA